MDFEKYKNKMPYPPHPAKPRPPLKADAAAFRAHADSLEKWEKDMEEYKTAQRAWQDEENRLDAMFRADVLEEEGLTGNPKADKVFAKAWEFGHGAGKSEVANYVRELADLVK